MVWYGKGFNEDDDDESYHCKGLFCGNRICRGDFCSKCIEEKEKELEKLKTEIKELKEEIKNIKEAM